MKVEHKKPEGRKYTFDELNHGDVILSVLNQLYTVIKTEYVQGAISHKEKIFYDKELAGGYYTKVEELKEDRTYTWGELKLGDVVFVNERYWGIVGTHHGYKGLMHFNAASFCGHEFWPTSTFRKLQKGEQLILTGT